MRTGQYLAQGPTHPPASFGGPLKRGEALRVEPTSLTGDWHWACKRLPGQWLPVSIASCCQSRGIQHFCKPCVQTARVLLNVLVLPRAALLEAPLRPAGTVMSTKSSDFVLKSIPVRSEKHSTKLYKLFLLYLPI